MKLICVSRNGATSCWEYTNPEKTSEHQNPRFSRRRKVNLCQNVESGVQISAATINKPNKLLVTAFTNGIFCIHEINDDFTLLQSFRAGEQRINSVDINRSGEWLAIGCGTGHATQLLVWEWKSESYILRQQSHSQTITTAVYSPDGSILATGAEDGKVKLWDYATSLCLVTFNEHETGVTDVCFTQSGRAILSASLEGAIRAHDLKRYRNFRTLTAPKQTQLDHICADNSGDIVMATSRDHFEIYIWALETGQCLGILTGHADLISGLATFENTLCSVSNDKTLKFWNILEGSCVESVQLLSDGLDVKYSPSGSMLAVLCYDSNIDLFDTRNTKQIGVIETKLDIDAGRLRAEKVKKSKLEKNKTFTCIAFLPNGQYLLAGGQSNVFCLYSVPDKIRVRTFRLSMNLSLDGTAFDFDYRKATEFGHLDLFDLTDSDEEETNPHKRIRLPGTRHTDLSERAIKPAILINKISFSPTGQDFAVVSTEGVHIFTLSQSRHFEPFKLEVNVTSQEILKMSRTGEHIRALMLALKLNDETLLKNVVERIPVEQIRFVITSLGIEFAERLLAWIGATNCRTSAPNRHFHFYLLICKELLYAYGNDFKRSLERNKPALTAIQRNIAHQQNLIMNLSAQNKHTLEYLIMTRNMAMTQLSTD